MTDLTTTHTTAAVVVAGSSVRCDNVVLGATVTRGAAAAAAAGSDNRKSTTGSTAPTQGVIVAVIGAQQPQQQILPTQQQQSAAPAVASASDDADAAADAAARSDGGGSSKSARANAAALTTSDKVVKVRWADGSTGLYRVGASGCFDLVYSDMIVPYNMDGCAVDAGTAVLGASVSRGRDWPFSDGHDAVRGGHVISSEVDAGWVRVRWGDGSVRRYRAGCTVACVDPTTTTTAAAPPLTDAAAAPSTAARVMRPAFDLVYGERWHERGRGAAVAPRSLASSLPKEADPVSRGNFAIGARVVPGPSWRWGADQCSSGFGTLTKIDDEDWVRVKWADGSKRSYRAGADGAHDLQYDVNPLAPVLVRGVDRVGIDARTHPPLGLRSETAVR